MPDSSLRPCLFIIFTISYKPYPFANIYFLIIAKICAKLIFLQYLPKLMLENFSKNCFYVKFTCLFLTFVTFLKRTHKNNIKMQLAFILCLHPHRQPALEHSLCCGWRCKRPPFKLQKATFCNAKCRVLRCKTRHFTNS